ncbi:MAG TPA: disulfide bond formation protein B [Steroidobacteraceae bacterium]|nr:disulfide bond formation protein B [Steroidobacteraceae bacterium]
MVITRREVNFAGAAVCALLLGYAYYLQYFGHLEPCPLCIFQRIAVLALAVVFLIAALHDPQKTGARIYGVLIDLAALAGIAVAARHIYIQSLPPGQVPSCGATLDYMLEVFPLTQVIRTVLTGSGECGVVDWTFLGLSMPWWVLISLTLLGAMGLVANWRLPRRRPPQLQRSEPYIG